MSWGAEPQTGSRDSESHKKSNEALELVPACEGRRDEDVLLTS